MPLYEYRAVDDEGRPKVGSMEEASSRRVTAILQEQGFQVSSVDEKGGTRGIPRLRRALSWEDVDFLNHELAALVNSRLPMAPALKSLARDVRNRRLRSVFVRLHDELERGATLEEALSANEGAFPPVYLSIIRAGERSGNLAGVLQTLTRFSTRMVETKTRAYEALIYPVVVIVAGFALSYFLMTEVVPDYANAFSGFGTELPWLTRAILSLGHAVDTGRWLLLALFVLLLFAGFLVPYFINGASSLGYVLDAFRRRLWFAGQLFHASSMARFSQSLCMMLAGRVPLKESIELAGAASGSAVIREAALDAAEDVERGERIADALENTQCFDHGFCWMLAAAEERGDVPEALDALAENYERQAERLGRVGLVLLGPAAVLTVGVFVGLIVLALYLPLFSMLDNIVF